MNIFVQTLRRLYLSEKISEVKINELLKAKKITKEEHLFILGKEGNQQ